MTRKFADTLSMEDIKLLLPDARVILDCGASLGNTVAMYRRFYPEAEIYAFEPRSEAFGQLCVACEELNAHPVRLAVGDYVGSATMHITRNRESSSMLDFQPGNPCEWWTRVVARETVGMVTLDKWCEVTLGGTSVDLLKLDLQGGELPALRGATELLKMVKLVYAEVQFVELYKDAPLYPDVSAFMAAAGFREYALYASPEPDNWGDALYVKEGCNEPH